MAENPFKVSSMIYSFGASNLNSFKDGFKVSFELGSKVPKSISHGRKTSNVIGIKGANASGKTNILKALSSIADIAVNSFTLKPDQRLIFSPYFDSEKNTSFYIDLEAGGSRYIYEILANERSIVRERIYKKVARKTLILERQENKIISRTQELSELDIIELRSNASVISTAAQYKFKKPVSDLLNIYHQLRLVRGNVFSFGVNEDPQFFKVDNVSELYYTNKEAFEFAKKQIREADLGIVDIVISEREGESGQKRYFPLFLHLSEKKNHYLTIYDQSSGTVSLYKRLWVYWCVLATGGTLVLDEFDANCHPQLLPNLISLFDDPEVNRYGAQFIFTAQNSEILDTLGKYRTILVNKEQGESYCYRLDEIPGDLVRNDRPISPLYREGKIGGVPNL